MFGATWWAVQLFVGGWVDGTLEEIIKGVVQINQLCCGRGASPFSLAPVTDVGMSVECRLHIEQQINKKAKTNKWKTPQKNMCTHPGCGRAWSWQRSKRCQDPNGSSPCRLGPNYGANPPTDFFQPPSIVSEHVTFRRQILSPKAQIDPENSKQVDPRLLGNILIHLWQFVFF